MSPDPSAARGRASARRAGALGFLVGAAITVPAVVLALLLPLGERLLPFLTPGVVLLRPLSAAMAGWSGGVNMLLASLANGLVVGSAVAAAVLLVGRLR